MEFLSYRSFAVAKDMPRTCPMSEVLLAKSRQEGSFHPLHMTPFEGFHDGLNRIC